MPTVPIPSPQVQAQGIPSVRVSTDAPIEAFGGGQSAQALTQATEGLAGAVGEIAKEEKHKADQVAFMAADRALAEHQTQVQITSSKMLGKDAAGAPDYARSEFDKKVSEITKGLANDAQRMAFSEAANSRYKELDRHVQIHASTELQKYDDQETAGYLATSRSTIALNYGDDQTIQSELQKQQGALNAWAQRKGLAGSEDFKKKLSEELSVSHQAVIEARLNAGDTDQAKTYFEANKASMSAADILHADKAIENADVITKGLAAYDDTKSLKLPDGTPDEAKMRAKVWAMDDLSDKRKEKVWEFVKARTAEDIANKNRQEAATDRSFMNAAVDARKQGVPMAEALKLATQFGTDDYDQSIKASAIQKIYAANEHSDPEAFINIWERIQSGGSSKQEIDEAFQKKSQLNAADWRHLREEYFKFNSEGKNTEMAQTFERIKVLADDKFGSNKVNRESFLYEMHQQKAQGKSPEEVWKIANDKLKDDPNTGIWGMFQSAQWKTDLQRSDANNLAWGKVYQDMGKQEAMAIGQGALYGGKQSWGLGDVDSFAAQFGGYDKIKPGTPVHNAIQSLMKKGQLVTPANVKAVVNRYADGHF